MSNRSEEWFRDRQKRAILGLMAHMDPDLWVCPKCGEKFTTKKAWHSCGQFTLADLFRRCDPVVLETYQALEAMALDVAEFHVIVQKTRVSFQLRTRCAGGTPYKSYFRFHFLARTIIAHPRILKVESYAKDQHGHAVRLNSPADVDDQIQAWLVVSTQYGEQRAS